MTYRTFSSPQKEGTHNNHPSFITCDCYPSGWLGWSGTPQTELLLHSYLPDPWDPRLHTFSVRAPGKAREASRGFFCLPEQGPVSISLLLSHPPQLDGKRGRAPRLLLVFHPLHFSQGWKDEIPWAYFSFELSDIPEPPHLLFRLCHHTEQIIHLFTVHAGVFPTILQHLTPGSDLPAAKGVDIHLLLKELCSVNCDVGNG